jgi:hypothetical protein
MTTLPSYSPNTVHCTLFTRIILGMGHDLIASVMSSAGIDSTLRVESSRQITSNSGDENEPLVDAARRW